MNAPLGTLRSWILDGTLAGALLPPTAMVASSLLQRWLDGTTQPAGFSLSLLLATLLGGTLGLLLSLPSLWIARSLWRAPALVLALGPCLGALCAAILEGLLCPQMGVPASRVGTDDWWILVGFGAFLLGPPWMAYVAVRGRGRPGTPVVLASILWACLSIGMVVGFTWLRS